MASIARNARKEAERHLRNDALLGPVVRRVGPCAIVAEGNQPLFAALFRVIIHQQLNGRAAQTILERVQRLFPADAVMAAEALSAISDTALREAGLSRAKLASARDLAAHVLAGQLPTTDELGSLTDEEIEQRLTIVRGIGPWSVHMYLIFHLGRPDVWPVGDFGVRTAVMRLMRKRKLPEVDFMERVGRAWRPWRSAASWYLWRFLELPDGKA